MKIQDFHFQTVDALWDSLQGKRIWDDLPGWDSPQTWYLAIFLLSHCFYTQIAHKQRHWQVYDKTAYRRHGRAKYQLWLALKYKIQKQVWNYMFEVTRKYKIQKYLSDKDMTLFWHFFFTFLGHFVDTFWTLFWTLIGNFLDTFLDTFETLLDILLAFFTLLWKLVWTPFFYTFSDQGRPLQIMADHGKPKQTSVLQAFVIPVVLQCIPEAVSLGIQSIVSPFQGGSF